MTAKPLKTVVVPVLCITLFGVLMLAASFMLYYGFYLFVERFFYAGQTQNVRTDLLRRLFAVLYGCLYLLLHRINKWELAKATLMVGPLGTIVVTIVLSYYTRMHLALLYSGIFLALVIAFLYLFKKPWYYYYAIVVTLVPALWYAWPR